jgi:hypothetical protein
MRLVTWVTSQVSQKQWEASGYAKAMADQQAAISENIGFATQIYKETAGKTTEQLNRDLME